MRKTLQIPGVVQQLNVSSAAPNVREVAAAALSKRDGIGNPTMVVARVVSNGGGIVIARPGDTVDTVLHLPTIRTVWPDAKAKTEAETFRSKAAAWLLPQAKDVFVTAEQRPDGKFPGNAAIDRDMIALAGALSSHIYYVRPRRPSPESYAITTIAPIRADGDAPGAIATFLLSAVLAGQQEGAVGAKKARGRGRVVSSDDFTLMPEAGPKNK